LRAPSPDENPGHAIPRRQVLLLSTRAWPGGACNNNEQKCSLPPNLALLRVIPHRRQHVHLSAAIPGKNPTQAPTSIAGFRPASRTQLCRTYTVHRKQNYSNDASSVFSQNMVLTLLLTCRMNSSVGSAGRIMEEVPNEGSDVLGERSMKEQQSDKDDVCVEREMEQVSSHDDDVLREASHDDDMLREALLETGLFTGAMSIDQD
uniref:Uncharacterized protein n=1 Tax=Oryza glaberrima TaxID=4538 RepID=I1Q9S8_ORYGL